MSGKKYYDTEAEFRLVLGKDLKSALQAEAEAQDLALSPFVASVLRGAVKLGQISRLFEAGAEGVSFKRRPRKPLPWVATTEGIVGVKGVTPPKAATWSYGPWILDRVTSGYTNANRYKKGEGWFLTGPGIEDPILCGWRRPDAMDRATEIIRHYERTQGKDDD